MYAVRVLNYCAIRPHHKCYKPYLVIGFHYGEGIVCACFVSLYFGFNNIACVVLICVNRIISYLVFVLPSYFLDQAIFIILGQHSVRQV